MAQPNPWDNDPIVGAAPAGGGGPVYGVPAKPDKPNPGVGYQMGPDGTAKVIPGGQADIDKPAPGDATKTGEEYLKSLSPEMAAQVRALSEGRRAFPSGAALRSPQVQELVAAASQFDPTLDAANATTRVATRKDFTSGVTARNITAINTALGHLGTLYEAGQGLHNRAIPAWNTLANGVESAVGDPRVNNFNLARQAVVDELERAFRGAGGGTEAGIAAWKESINSSQSPEQLKAAIAQGVTLLDSRLAALGDQYSRGLGSSADPMQFLSPHAQEVYNHLRPSGDGLLPPGGAAAPPGGGGSPGAPPGTPPGSPPSPMKPDFGDGADAMTGATGDQRLVADPETQAHVDAMMRSGASYGDVNAYAVSKGMAPVNRQEWAAVSKFLRQNPNYSGSLINAHKYIPVTTTEKVITTLGNNPVGAYVANAGQFLSGNTIDNIAPDPERAREALGVISAQNPTASAVGQVSGGVMASMLGEAGLARAGMAGGVGRSAVADMVMGGANGAGAADNGGRVTGGVEGALSAVAGSLGGAGVTKGVARAFSPTGGALADLYGAGVRPTIGQRVANANDGKGLTGMAGKAVNATEEALQSVPVIGSAIRGARQEARDQFQVGGFNQALSDIGEQLPAGVGPGNEAHKLATEAFNRVYDKARSGMKLVADEELSNDLSSLTPDIGSLGPQAQARLRAILTNRVSNRMTDGVADGQAYKRMISGLGDQIGTLSKNPQDMELAGVLSNVKTALENAARRHSDPAAVELLDAADLGYAKLVRLQGASARRGGDSGTFSPTQLDAEVQKQGGGVRSGAYNRGDALMQDYAKQGMSLADRLPNSGTADRGMIAGGLLTGGAAYLEPSTLAVLGAIGTAYAPGVRKVVNGAMAPTTNATAKAISAQLEKRALLAGKVGAATAAVHELGTSPGQ